MRAMFVAMCAVLILALGTCTISMRLQFRMLDALEKQCGGAISCVLDDDIAGAMEYVQHMKLTVEKSTRFMEMVASHDQLHEALGNITDAQVALECEDMDDAYQALAELEGVIDHMRAHETLSLENIC